MSVQPNKARLRTLLQGLKQNVDIGAESRLGMGGGQLNTVVLSGGGTTTLTAANSGATCVFDTAATSNFTLPAPELGMRFTFIQTIINTADHVIQSATDGHGFIGGVLIMNTTADQTNAFASDVDGSNDFITLNATTTGGAAAGTRIEVVALTNTSGAGCWAVSGTIIGSGNTITPFGDAQI